jgi:hypothetical protein
MNLLRLVHFNSFHFKIGRAKGKFLKKNGRRVIYIRKELIKARDEGTIGEIIFRLGKKLKNNFHLIILFKDNQVAEGPNSVYFFLSDGN